MRFRGSWLSVLANVSWILALALLLVPMEIKRENPWMDVVLSLAMFTFSCVCLVGFIRAFSHHKARINSEMKGQNERKEVEQ